MLKNGFIQVYTGNGKGKTTAALGQALRAAGDGLKSYFLMLMKEFPYSEVKALDSFSGLIKVVQACGDEFVYKRVLPSGEEKSKAKNALNDAFNAMHSNKFDIIILDEALVSIYFKLISIEDILPFFNEKPANVELILTGRYCPQELIEKADLVTEMKEVKHYYEKGVLSRRGIES